MICNQPVVDKVVKYVYLNRYQSRRVDCSKKAMNNFNKAASETLKLTTTATLLSIHDG